MSISTNEIIGLVGDLCEEEGIKVGVKESVKGGVITGSAATVAGILLGPIGLALGGVFGGLTSYYLTQGKFESVVSVINKLEPSRKKILVNRVRDYLQNNGISHVGQFAAILKNPSLKGVILQMVIGLLVALAGFVVNFAIEKLMSKKNQETCCIVRNDGTLMTLPIENISNQL